MKLLNLLAGIAAASVLVTGAVAEEYPTRALNWVVPFTPGGVTDTGARTVAKVLSEKLKQPVVVENRPGAGGIVGAEYVVNAKKDGYTFLYTSNGVAVTYPFLYKKMSFNPQTDLLPVHGMAMSPMLVMVRADSPHKTLADLIAYAKKNPEKLNFASVGQGSTQHLLAELLQAEAGFKMTHIPYKGTAPALTDTLGGAIDVMFDYAVIMKPQMEAGKLRALAVSGEKRLTSLPDVPTIIELGHPNVSFTAWSSITMPAGTPQPIVDKLAKAFGESLEHPDVVKYFTDQGSAIMQGVAKEKLSSFYDSERAKMKAIVDRANIQPE